MQGQRRRHGREVLNPSLRGGQTLVSVVAMASEAPESGS